MIHKSLIYFYTVKVIAHQEAQLKEGFDKNYNIDIMSYQKWLLTK